MQSSLEASRPVSIKAWLALVGLSLIWGTSYILIKRGLVAYTPVQLACIRLSVSAIAFLPFFIKLLHKVSRQQLRYLLVVGITGTAAPSFLFAIAQTEVSSSVAGILNSMAPIFTLLLGMLFFGSRPSLLKSMGVGIGMLGAISLIVLGSQVGLQGNLWYGLFIILATICYATSTNVVGFHLKSVPSLVISAVSFSMVGIPALIYLFTGSEFMAVLRTHPAAWESLAAIVILALFSTVLASIIYFRLVQLTSPVFGSTVAYLVPMVALLWGIVDAEQITILHFLGMVLILVGVWLSRR